MVVVVVVVVRVEVEHDNFLLAQTTGFLPLLFRFRMELASLGCWHLYF